MKTSSNRKPNAFIAYDQKKCQGCATCMMACSLVKVGEENLLLSRIRVTQNSFDNYPDDISLTVCRQCSPAPCQESCPTDAITVDPENNGIPTINRSLCTGCQLCLEACPSDIGGIVWIEEKDCAIKCDLCVDSPFWDKTGGVEGSQACISVCPVGAIKLINSRIDHQAIAAGQNINLRGEGWAKIGYPTT